jgi:hypothetical protein
MRISHDWYQVRKLQWRRAEGDGFILSSPWRLASLQAHNGGGEPSTLTLRCAGQTDRQVTLAPGQTLTIETGWTGLCSSVTVASTNCWDVNIDNLLLVRGAASP